MSEMEAMKPRKEQGFTLIEALLVITIGTVLLGSGTVLYNQYRQSVGDSAAYDKVVAFQSCVESAYAVQNASYSDIVTIRRYWQAKRPLDYNMSPWGGRSVSGAGNNHFVQGDYRPIGGAVPDPTQGDYGMLYYWYTSPANGALSASDSAGGGVMTASYLNYLVAIVPNTYTGSPPPYHFVRGSRIGLGSGSNQRVFGQVGDTANNTVDPW